VCFDYYRDTFWLHSRTFIVSGFLTLVGISMVLANRRGFQTKPFFRRLGLLALYAALVSLSTYIQVGERWVYFGILHFIAVASVLGLLFVRWQWLSLLIGIVVIAVGLTVHIPLFDPQWLNWIGLMTHKPQTNDYVPLFPWFGVVLVGIFLGHGLIRQPSPPTLAPLLAWQSSHLMFKALSFLGRQAIHVYIIHVPLFIGVIMTINWMTHL